MQIARDEAQYPAAVSPDPVCIPARYIQHLAPLVGRFDPFHVETDGISLVLEEDGFLGQELPGNSLLLVKYGRVMGDPVVSGLSLPEPFLGIGLVGLGVMLRRRERSDES